jgi:N,N-dimethylformamidase
MLPLAGYADRMSVRPGETLTFHVSNSTGKPVTTRLARVQCADTNPAGPGLELLDVASGGLKTLAEPKAEPVHRGSYARIDGGDVFARLTSWTFVATIQPTLIGKSEMAVLSLLDQANARGAGIAIDRQGRLMLSIAGGQGWRRIEAPNPLEVRTWYSVWVSFDGARGEGVIGLKSHMPGTSVRLVPFTCAGRPLGVGTLLMGAAAEGKDPFRFNGRIERPALYNRALAPDEAQRAASGGTVDGLVAAWDFSKDMHTQRIADTGPHGLHGTLVNFPARAMKGSNWTGREPCFRHAPEQYGAIHFHDDDLDDCRWPATHAFTVPRGLKSGAYALLLTAGDVAENIPFVVLPEKGKPTAKIAVLMSTFTYTVYHNFLRPEWERDPKWRDGWRAQTKAWGAYPNNPGEHQDYGLSTYNYHSDGSGIHSASWMRPMLNVRIGFINYPFPEIRGSGLRHFPADTHLLAWLEAKGFDCDLMTDWELHHEGCDLLEQYKVVMTGTHPEYHTSETLDALEQFRDNGGRFMYLGGNGFYWKIALSKEKPGLIEIRRAEGGIRAWAAEPGEYYNQLDGEYGGLWRRNGRPPQKLSGVGFTAQGNFIGSHYRVLPEARSNPRVAWMFEGVSSEKIGGFGFSGNGAAGFELDRADKKLGTPSHAVVMAQSEDHPPEAPWVLVPEEQLTHIMTTTGESHKQLIRADLTFFEAPNNGAVFSTGSITYCGSLPHNDFDNDISRLTENVLRRFLDPAAKFPMPETA